MFRCFLLNIIANNIDLSKFYIKQHGPFNVPVLNVDTSEHQTKIELLKGAKFAGKYMMVMEGAGCDNSFVFDDVANLHSFLAMNKDSKANCQNIEYSLNTLTELNRVWNVDMSMAVSYAEDFDIIKKNHSANDRTVRPDKYITVTFDEIAQELE